MEYIEHPQKLKVSKVSRFYRAFVELWADLVSITETTEAYTLRCWQSPCTEGTLYLKLTLSTMQQHKLCQRNISDTLLAADETAPVNSYDFCQLRALASDKLDLQMVHLARAASVRTITVRTGWRSWMGQLQASRLVRRYGECTFANLRQLPKFGYRCKEARASAAMLSPRVSVCSWRFVETLTSMAAWVELRQQRCTSRRCLRVRGSRKQVCVGHSWELEAAHKTSLEPPSTIAELWRSWERGRV